MRQPQLHQSVTCKWCIGRPQLCHFWKPYSRGYQTDIPLHAHPQVCLSYCSSASPSFYGKADISFNFASPYRQNEHTVGKLVQFPIEWGQNELDRRRCSKVIHGFAKPFRSHTRLAGRLPLAVLTEETVQKLWFAKHQKLLRRTSYVHCRRRVILQRSSVYGDFLTGGLGTQLHPLRNAAGHLLSL